MDFVEELAVEQAVVEPSEEKTDWVASSMAMLAVSNMTKLAAAELEEQDLRPVLNSVSPAWLELNGIPLKLRATKGAWPFHQLILRPLWMASNTTTSAPGYRLEWLKNSMTEPVAEPVVVGWPSDWEMASALNTAKVAVAADTSGLMAVSNRVIVVEDRLDWGMAVWQPVVVVDWQPDSGKALVLSTANLAELLDVVDPNSFLEKMNRWV